MVNVTPSLRVLMTADPIGGVWTFSLDLMEGLQDAGVQFALATMGRKLSAEQRKAVKLLENVRLYEGDYKLEWMDDPWTDVEEAGEWLLRITQEFQPDLIHLNGYVHASLPWERPVLVTAHSCVYSWFSDVKGCNPPAETWRPYQEKVARGLEAASLVTAPSETMLRSLSTHYGTLRSPGIVIYNGRPTHRFQAGVKEKIILTGGRLWDEAKNVQVLDQAASALPWPVVAAGEKDRPGAHPVHLRNLQFLGSLPPRAFARELSRTAIFAHPARYEPFGLSPLEAAFSGCALALGDIPSLREIWGDAAVFVSPNDTGAWAAALNELVCNGGFRKRMADLARKRAQNFTLTRTTRGYLDAYGSILNLNERKHENRSFLSLTPVRLESRQRPLSPRLRH